MAENGWSSPLAEFESQFNHTSAMRFMDGIWHYSLYISILYVISIFGIKKYMENRPKFNLRGPLMFWSILLAVFSLRGFCVSSLTHLIHTYKYGLTRSICDELMVRKQLGLWTFLFCFSKCPELIDTFFIVLRKQKLIFLHWYHHITVFIYSWHHYCYLTTPGQWFITMNYFVHTLMYTYYAVRASGVYRPPVWVNIVITSLQLLQMVVGVSINMYVYINLQRDPEWYCDGLIEKNIFIVYFALTLYVSYFILFVHFFYTSYLCKKQPTTKADTRNNLSHTGAATVNGNVVHFERTSELLPRSEKVKDGSKNQLSDNATFPSISSRNGVHCRK